MPVDPDSAEDIGEGIFTVTTDQSDYSPGSTAVFTAWNVGVGGTAEFQVQHLDPGSDGVLGTADDVLDAGADGAYGTVDDGYGPAPGDFASDHDLFSAIDGVGIEGLDGILGSDDDLLLDASTGLYSRDGLYADLDGEANGQISVGWYVREPDSLNELFRLTATSDGATDTTTFTDGQLALYAWRNQPGPTLNEWDAGTTIQQANSVYAEDEVIPFRWTSTAGGGGAPNMIEGVTYTIQIDYAHRGGTSDPGKFFFDYLTSYNATEGATNPFGPGSDLAGFQTGLLSTAAILLDTDPDILGEIAGFFSLYNIDPASVAFVGYSDDPVNINQEDRRLTFTFTPNDGDAIAGEALNVGIAWGAHLASQTDYGAGNGAANFPGASPQMVVDLSPTVSGDQSNININPNAIVPQGQITIIKDASPNSPQDFNFTITGPDGAPIPANFVLDDDGDPTTPAQITFVGLLEGTYVITEQLTAGWNLTNLLAGENGVEDTTAGDISTVNLAGRSITITVANGEVWTATFTNTVAPNPSLNIVKTAVAGQVADQAGELITYGITVANTGNQTLTGVTVTDANADAGIVRNADLVGDDDALLEVGETWSYTAQHTVTQAEIDTNGGGDGDLDNTAYADANETDPDSDDETVPVDQNPALNIVKTAVAGQVADQAGELITYGITVANTGNQTLTGVTVTDANADAGIVRNADLVGDDDALLEVGETWSYTAQHTVTQAEIDTNGGGDGDLDNTAYADANETDPDSDDETVPVDQNLSIAISKTTVVWTDDGQIDQEGDGLSGVQWGDEVSWNYAVTNTGNVTFTDVDIVDDNGTPGDTSDDFDTVGPNAPLPTIELYAVDQDGNGVIDGDDGDGVREAGEDWASHVSQAETDGLAVGGTWYYTSAPRSVVENGTVTYSNIATVTGSTELDLTATDSDDSGYVSLNAGYVTDSNFCDFGDTFNVIWSPDIDGSYRETSTQPGQFFYNVFGDFQQLFDDGDDGNNVLTLHIPDGFALQSPDAFFEQAIHVYDEYFIDPHSGELCFVWGEEVSRDEYTVEYVYNADGSFDARITFEDDASATGNFAVNIHLDHETEGIDGYTYANNGTGHQDMVNGPTGNLANSEDIYASPSVLDGTDYYFSASTGLGADEEMIATSGDTVSNVNDVKKFNFKGFAGFVWNDDGDGQYESGEGLVGRTVELWRGNTRLETMTTDDDGWYLSNFMHKGKLATYEIRIIDDESGSGFFSSGTLQLGKGNHFEMVSFDDSDNQVIHA